MSDLQTARDTHNPESASANAELRGRRLLGPLLLLALAAAVALAFWYTTRTPALTVQGEVSANRVDVSTRVAGRVASLAVDVGDSVMPGAVIAELESPQLAAALVAAEAALAVAQADLVRISSTRPETINARRAELAAAEADVTLSQESYDRHAELMRTGASPQSRVDEAVRNLEAAIRQREAAEANLQLAVAGASPEERQVAAAQVEQAAAAVEQRKTDIAELTIRSPIAGQVTTRIAETGENFGAGAPLFSIVDMNDVWFTFNLREDLLAGLRIGDTFTVTVPALGNAEIPVRVTMINVQGQYATWRATRATGDFDLRTFEVRAVPTQAHDTLRPGMSGITDWRRGER